MELAQRLKALNWLQKFILVILMLALLYPVVGFLILPPVIKSVLVNNLSKQLQRDVMIQKISVNPYLLTLRLNGFAIREKESCDRFAAFREFYVDLQALSLIKRALLVKEIKIAKPYIFIKRTETNRYNFSDLLQVEPSAEKEPRGPGIPRFSLNSIQIINGEVEIWDGPENN